MKKSYQKTMFLLAAMLAAQAVEAQAGGDSRPYRKGNSWVQEVSGTLAAAKTIRISTDAGSVKVIAGNQSNITYLMKKRVYNCVSDSDAQKYLNQFRITAWQQGDTAVLRGVCEFCGHNRKHGSVDFDIVVPKDVAVLNIQTDGGDLSVNGINGRMEAETGGGNIEALDVGGLIRASSGGGNITVGKAGGDLTLETGGGTIRVVSTKGRVNAHSGGGKIQIESGQAMVLETGGGSIEVGSCNGDLRATTGGGNITAGSVTGRTFLETGGGSIRLSSSNGPVSAQSGGGSIELYKLRQGALVETGGGGIVAEFVALGPGATASHLETGAGDVVVYLADDLKVTVNAAIDVGNGHAIYSDFSGIKVTADGDDPGPQEYYATGSLNGGGPQLKIHTAVGNIELRKQTLAQK